MKKLLDYTDWRDEYRDILKSFTNKDVLFSFSAGKDSSLALDFFLKAGDEFHFDFEVHAGAFPVHRYTNIQKTKIGDYWKRRGIDIIWHSVLETDEIMRKTENPCRACQELRRKLLKNFINDNINNLENLVIIAGFSLWDIVGYSLEHILGGIFSFPNDIDKSDPGKRFIEISQRFYPCL